MKIKTRRYYVYYLLMTALLFARLIPLRILLVLAEFAGKLGFEFLSKYREIAISNLDRVFPRDHETNKKIAEKVFVNFVKNGAEWVKFLSMSPADVKKMIPEVRGREHLDEVLSRGKGALVLGFHFGNWELLGIGLRVLGYPGALVARRIYFDKYDAIITGMRARFNARVIYRDESPKKMLMELKKGNVLGIVPDQDVDSVDGVFVDFLGFPAHTPTAPVKLASAAGTSIVPVFVVRGEGNRHTMIIEKPIHVPERIKDKEEITRYTKEWSDMLESYVRKYPEQWVWVHKRWKTVPTEDSNVGVAVK